MRTRPQDHTPPPAEPSHPISMKRLAVARREQLDGWAIEWQGKLAAVALEATTRVALGRARVAGARFRSAATSCTGAATPRCRPSWLCIERVEPANHPARMMRRGSRVGFMARIDCGAQPRQREESGCADRFALPRRLPEPCAQLNMPSVRDPHCGGALLVGQRLRQRDALDARDVSALPAGRRRSQTRTARRPSPSAPIGPSSTAASSSGWSRRSGSRSPS